MLNLRRFLEAGRLLFASRCKREGEEKTSEISESQSVLQCAESLWCS